MIETRFDTSYAEVDMALDKLIEGLPKYQLTAVKLRTNNGIALNITIYDARRLPAIIDRAKALESKGIGKLHLFLNGKEMDTSYFK